MALFPLAVFLVFSGFNSLTESNPAHQPRMIFTDKETEVKRAPLPEHVAPVRIVLGREPGTATAVGQKHLFSFNFQSPDKTPVEREVLWEQCMNTEPPQKDCSYNFTLVHEREETNRVFACGINGRETMCCDLNLSEGAPTCVPSEKMAMTEDSIRDFLIKEGEQSALVETAGHADLYITYSGSQEYVGIHKFGKNRVGPAYHAKEQHYLGLVLSSPREDPLQDKVYAFYKEKNRHTDLHNKMWLPFVTQVCTADIGGPKSHLQFSWTSQMNARLFCGDPDRRQHFSELVDVATVHAERWQDTRVYALFRNEWNMSAVCLYTIGDIDHVFTTSPFKGSQKDRTRACVSDSQKIHVETLKLMESTSEMEQWVLPVKDSSALLFSHHSYTHIHVDDSQHRGNNDHAVLFLSLKNGRIHKVLQQESQTFVIAEYQPFQHPAHILSVVLHPSSRKLYVNSRSELVQLDVANCARYGDSCEDCALARDPYCSWNGSRCAPATPGTQQDVVEENLLMCKSQSPGKVFKHSDARADQDVDVIRLPAQSKYFLQCPVSSHHAQYTWRHAGSSASCSQREQPCLFLIDSMGPEQVGTYRCVSQERGYSRVLAQYRLQLEGGAAGRSSGPLVWVCLLAALIIKSLSS
ncbi:semaphorin-7A-like [Pempheris klunzingeri]|uniref:semaphorin-7A-like n=1 Tax=Pempheris klunzingeri TaxID=3127111 RepID=UPI00397F18DC